VLIKFEDRSDAEEFLQLAQFGEYHIDWPVLSKLPDCEITEFTTDLHVELKVSSGA
jgi:hypothetical protein